MIPAPKLEETGQVRKRDSVIWVKKQWVEVGATPTPGPLGIPQHREPLSRELEIWVPPSSITDLHGPVSEVPRQICQTRGPLHLRLPGNSLRRGPARPLCRWAPLLPPITMTTASPTGHHKKEGGQMCIFRSWGEPQAIRRLCPQQDLDPH